MSPAPWIVQTIPSLAMFGFLLPVPFLGGVGARAAIVVLILYGREFRSDVLQLLRD